MISLRRALLLLLGGASCQPCWEDLSSSQWLACKGLHDAPSSCMRARMPATVLSVMIDNDRFPNVTRDNYYTGDNILKVPDMSVAGRDFYTYYYKTSLSLRDSCLAKSQRSFLVLKGASYRVTVYVNGKAVGERGGGDVGGMFYERKYELAGGLQQLELAVLTTPVDFPGTADGNQGGDHQMARNGAVMQYTLGWDWCVGVPDRNSGIFDRVLLRGSMGRAHVESPHLRLASLAIGGEAAIEATIDVSVDSTAALLGTAYLIIAESPIEGPSSRFLSEAGVGALFSATELEVSPGASTARLPPLAMASARLWSPREPFLYFCRVGFLYTEDGRTIDDFVSLRYGVRRAESYIDGNTSGHAFKINGRALFLTGGNWIGSDQLLRHAADYERYRSELLLHKAMGFNVVRVWGGGVAENDIFFDACDELGLLVIQDLWMTGDNNGRWAGNYSWPDDHAAYLANAESVFRRNRNRASLLMYAFGNELYSPSARESSPPADITAALQALLASLDADRLYISSTMAPQSSEQGSYDASYALAANDGPYGLLLTHQWYNERNPGLVNFSRTAISFQPEVGSVSTPCYRSLLRMLGEGGAGRSYPRSGAQAGDVHPVWAFHKYLPYTSRLADGSLHDHVYAYGAIESTKQFAQVAQVVQFDQYRALFEGYQLHQFEFYAGVLVWKSQGPWPALRGALYDYYLVPTGGFYGVRAALAGDFHVQLNPKTLEVSVINRDIYRAEPPSSAEVLAIVIDFDGTTLYERSLTIVSSSLAERVTTLSGLPLHWPPGRSGDVLLFRLVLAAADGRVLSANTYWLTDPAAAGPPDYSMVRAQRSKGLPTVEAQACYRRPASGELVATVALLNTAEAAAFMLRLAVLDGAQEVAPAFYSDNFLTLLGGEAAEVVVSFAEPQHSGLVVEVEGLNVGRLLLDMRECIDNV